MSKLPAPYRALQEEMAARHRRDECTIAQLRARNTELERKLADSVPRSRYNAANADYEELKTQLAAVQENANRQINELERKLAEENERKKVWENLASDYADKNLELAQRAEQAEQRIAESRRQEPVKFVTVMDESTWIHPNMVPVEKLYAAPIVPPTVEEAVSAETEKWKRILRESCDESRSELMYEQGFICSGAQRAVEEAVKAEREACAKICENIQDDNYYITGINSGEADSCADAIRARSGK